MEFKDYEKISVATDVVMLAGDIRQTNEVKSTDDYILKILLIKLIQYLTCKLIILSLLE